jgi:uncharacterized protein (UPF0212 family)
MTPKIKVQQQAERAKKRDGTIACPHCGAPLEFAVGSGATDGVISVVLQVKVK